MFINCHTHYSFRYGTISEEELLQLAAKHHVRKIALTDINNTSACLNFIRLAPKYDIKPIIGIDFRNGITQEFIGLARNNKGFQELNEFLSFHSHNKLTLPDRAPEFQNTVVIYPYEKLSKKTNYKLRENEYVGIKLSEINKLKISNLGYGEDKFIFLHPISFLNKTGFNTHRLIRAIGQNVLLSKLSIDEQAQPDEILLAPEIIRERLKEYPRILFNTDQLLDQCNVQFDFSSDRKPQNIKTYTGKVEDDLKLLKQECANGLAYRYNTITSEIKNRLKKELDLIEQMGYMAFFLTNWDIVEYAKRQGYYHVGRGSGANSLVAYLLGITDVDPIDLDLYFERFMNLYRANPPDFDIDFSWRDREDVTRYIFDRFGKEGQVALLATYNTFQYSGAVREMGKVFGLPKHEIDILSKGRFKMSSLDHLSQLTLKYASQIQGMPNHLSVHSAGILISEKPIHYFTATDLPPKGFATTQFDMIISEDVGLYKYDILGQRGLGKIKDAISLVKQNQPDARLVDIHDVKPLLQDPNINGLIRQAKCIGCFYVESPAMRMLLRKLEVDNYLGLVAASSIIRPGVAKSGMMREYILRHKNPERRKLAHPVMWDIMPDTYGVMVYQEDVIKVAHIYAGLDLGEADVLRRGMSGKYRSRAEFQKVKEKFISNCREKGEPDKTIQEIWKQTESFAGYAFAKGHSASYAVESYQSLYLKAYFPLEYMVAVLNNGGGFYRPELYIHEARKCGAIIHAPCINHSEYETTLKGNNIYLGFHLLNNLDRETSSKIVASRYTSGLYTSLDDFMDRNFLGIEQLDILVRINAFRSTGINRRSLLWKAYYHSHHQKPKVEQQQLFKKTSKDFAFPKFEISELEDAFDQIELLGFPLASPFILLETPCNSISAEDLVKYTNSSVSITGYLITAKRTKTANGKEMFFGTFLDTAGDWIDTVHFPPIAAKFPFRGKGIYNITGKVVEEFGFQTIEVESMERLPYVADPRYAISKDNSQSK